MTITVNEIFHSIQGESSYSGWPCVFVRLTGCNLRCSYCDTTYAYTGGQEMKIDQVIGLVASYGCNLIEITGGEPLLQPEAAQLIQALLDLGYTVLLETNGSRDIGPVDRRCVKIVDLKCPGSGELAGNDLANLGKLSDHDELKFVIGSREDFEWAKEMVKTVPGYPGKQRNIWFSTDFGRLAPAILAEWIIKEHLNVRLQLQLHKYVWGPDEKGV